MSRFLLAAAALLVLPVLSEAQEPAQAASGTHTVVRGETLWDLSRSYFGDPFSWRLLHEANEDIIANPHWIYPGQVLTIPGLPARRAQTAEVRDPSQVTDVVVRVGDEWDAQTAAERMATERTVFFRTDERRVLSSGVISREDEAYLAVPRDIFYSAGWLEHGAGAPEHLATIEAFEREARVRAAVSRTIAQPFESLLIRFSGSDRPGVGDRLLSFRVERTIENAQVVVPSGLLAVHRMESGGAIAVVTTEYNRVEIGDFLVRVPGFALEPGVHPAEVTDGMTATVLGFQRVRDFYGPGDVVFLDRGRAAGVAVGDEFVASVSPREGYGGRIGGTLQVVGVRESGSSARVIALDAPIFERGMTVRLSGKMP
ncbi:MAG: LysM peptidoglycan-binding domain-containing protein [Gemmatimonadota bacterium]